jgi:hypothetical protein
MDNQMDNQIKEPHHKYIKIWIENHKLVKNISTLIKHKVGFKVSEPVTMIMMTRQIPLPKIAEFLNILPQLVSLYTENNIQQESVGIEKCINFLTAFMIHYFPEHANCHDAHILKLSHKLVNMYDTFCNQVYPKKNEIVLFYYILNEFQTNFKIWKNELVEKELQELTQYFWTTCANVYQQLENAKQQIEYLQNYKDIHEEIYQTENPDKKIIPPIEYEGQNINTIIEQTKITYSSWNQQFESGFKTLKHKVLNQAQQINGQKGVEYVNNTIPIFVDPSFTENIRKQVHRAFWDSIEHDLKQTPPVYNKLINTISELKTYLMACVPNRLDIHQEINTCIDTDLWKQMLEHNAVDNNNISNLIQYVITKIKQWSSPSQTTNIDTWCMDLTKTMSNTNMTSNELISIVINFLKHSFTFLENIILDSQKFRNTTEFSQLKHRLNQLHKL